MHKASILIIDDEESLLNLFARFLAQEGYQVATALSGTEGIEKFKDGGYDLVISDLAMGCMDGLQVLREITEIDPHACVILLTGRGSLDSAVEAIRLGAADYLLKPCSGAELNFRVGASLEKKWLLERIRFFENILPVCCVCKKIRDDGQWMPGEGTWMEFPEFVEKKRGVKIQSLCCDQCSESKDGLFDKA